MAAEQLIVVETRRSKGTHKADVTKLSKDQVKELLGFYGSASYVALKNYRTNCLELKFERMGAKGLVSYCLKTALTEEDFKAIGFVPTEKGNLHFTQQGCSISRFDIEVKEPAKKISTRKEKVAKKEKVADSDKKAKAPLPPKAEEAKTTEEKPVEVKKAKAPLPAAK